MQERKKPGGSAGAYFRNFSADSCDDEPAQDIDFQIGGRRFDLGFEA